jgi:hypothetical protein
MTRLRYCVRSDTNYRMLQLKERGDKMSKAVNPKRRGGRRSRQKGDRAERGLVKLLQLAGVAAERTPLSGAVRSTRFGGGYDVSIPLFGRELKSEVKHHANGFARLYKWLAPVDILIVRADHSEPLAVMPLKFLLEVAKAAEAKHSPDT